MLEINLRVGGGPLPIEVLDKSIGKGRDPVRIRAPPDPGGGFEASRSSAGQVAACAHPDGYTADFRIEGPAGVAAHPRIRSACLVTRSGARGVTRRSSK